MKRCTKCILPETMPGISFDHAGVCCLCSDAGMLTALRNEPERFKRRLAEAQSYRRRVGSDYDVAVPISGGRDGCYVALELSKGRGLQVLCVNYANPFTSPQATENIQTIVAAANADLESFSWTRRTHERCLAANLQAWLKKPSLATSGLLCLACKAMYWDMFRIAHKHRVSLIVDGSNPLEVTTFKMDAMAGREAKRLGSWRTALNIGWRFLGNLSYLRSCNVAPAVATLLSLEGETRYLRWRYPNIKKTGYFYFYPYAETEIHRTLEAVGWQKDADNESPWRFDCEVSALKNYLLKRFFGITETDDLFSKNIRAGLMTREEAIGRLDEGNIDLDTVERVLCKLGLAPSILPGWTAARRGESNVWAGVAPPDD